MRLSLGPALLALLLHLAAARPATAADLARYTAVAIAPDAHSLAWVQELDGRSELHLTTLPNSSAGRILSPHTPTPCSNSNPVWSPDSRSLAFLSTCGAPASNPAQQQLFLYSPATGSTRQLTHLTGNLQQPAFSPDGHTLAFLFVQNATRSAGALDAMKPPSGVIGEDNIEVQRVAAIELSSLAFRFLTPPDLHAFEFSWHPNSGQIAFVAAPTPGENNWWVAKLYVQSTGAGPDAGGQARSQACGPPRPGVGCGFAADVAPPTALLDPATVPGPLHGLQIAVPRFSPDGRSIAFLGGLMSDQGATGGDIYLLSSTGGTPRNLTPDRPSTPQWITWTAPDTLLVSEDAQALTHLFRLDTATGVAQPANQFQYSGSLDDGYGLEYGISVASDGTVAAIRSSFSDPPEVAILPPGANRPSDLRDITHANDGLRGSAPRTDSVEWTSDNFHVQGWLTYPAHFDPARRYPILVSVHGGPSSSIRSRWGSETTFSDAGYFVLQPNPRGSFGQGERFTEANRKDFGYGDLRDILAGLDTVEHTQPIDPAREGLTGWSYGGFMTMFAVTQTHRFHAAIAGAGISDWQSYYGENSIDQWMTPFFGDTVYNDPAVYARSSAIDFIKNVTTPTLIIVGDRDGECPAPQSFEFWHALRAHGVPTQLVIYPAEGHRFRNPDHIADRTRRDLAWFAKYLPATPTTTPKAPTGN